MPCRIFSSGLSLSKAGNDKHNVPWRPNWPGENHGAQRLAETGSLKWFLLFQISKMLLKLKKKIGARD